MSEPIKPETDVRDPLGVATRVLVAQAFVLDRMFFRAAREAAVNDLSNRHMRKALKAQARCRATFKILIALGAVKRHPAKFSNLPEGTIQTLKTPVSPMLYEGATRSARPPRTDPTHKRLRAGRRWSAERRARQAAAIRSWQPWQNSSGPRTPDGKARSARNALKHGHESRAYVEMLREDRRMLNLAASNIAIAKGALRTLREGNIAVTSPFPRASMPWMALTPKPDLSAVARRAKAETQRTQPERRRWACRAVARLVRRSPTGEGGRAKRGNRIGIGRGSPALVPFARKFSGNRGHSGLLPGDNAAPRRRWRLARHDEEDVPLKQG